jgi:hypothetical protein
MPATSKGRRHNLKTSFVKNTDLIEIKKQKEIILNVLIMLGT